MNGGFQLGFPHTTFTDNSSIFKMTILAWPFTVIYECMNDFETVFTQIRGSKKGHLISIFNNSTKVIGEMWFLRKKMKMPWTDKVCNEDVLSRAQVKRKLMKDIRVRQLNFIGHITRKDSLENLVMTRRVE